MTAAPEARPRLLLVGNFLSGLGRNRTVCEDLAERLSAAGWTVRTVSRRPGRLARAADMVASAWRLRREFDLAHVDVYSGAAFRWAEAVCWTLRRAGKPYVLTLHGGALPQFARRHPGRVRRLLAGAARVTAPSPYLLRELGDEVPPGALLLPNPLELARYPFRERAAPRPALVWLRAFQELYNPLMAVRVLALLADGHPEARLVMVGPDKDGSLERVRAAAREQGVEGRLEIVPGVPRDEVPARLAAGDVFLNTTDVDNTPVSVLEAMACGLPVVSTAVGGIPHLLRDGEDALLVPPRDPEAMAAAVRRVLSEPGLAGRLSRAARESAAASDWGAVLPRWEALLRDAARSPAAAAAPGVGSSLAAGALPE